MQEIDLEAVVQGYLQAFEERDLSTCVGFFADDAMIDFQIAVFRGRQEIEEWHKARFAAGASVVDVDRVTVQGNKAIIEGAMTSHRLKALRLDRLSGKATLLFEQGQITEARLSAGRYDPIERM